MEINKKKKEEKKFKFFDQKLENPDDEVVKIRDYINSYGSQYGINNDMIDWKGKEGGGGNVLLGGQSIMDVDQSQLKDGRSYGSKLDLRSAIDGYAKENNLSNIKTGYENPYGEEVDALLQEILNYEKFSYSPENDPSFKSYKDQYTRAGNRAMEDTMGAAAGMTGGRTNSWSETVAGQAKAQWDDRLMDRIPELEQAAYGRYLNNRNMDVQNLQQLLQMDQTGYNRFADNRNFQRGIYESDRNFGLNEDQFDWQQDVDNRNFDYTKEIDNRNFDYSKEIDQRNFDYQISRDQVMDENWLKQFEANEQQRIVQNALQSKQISISEANSLLNQEQFEYKKERDKLEDSEIDGPETVGPLYTSMMNSPDPSKWLIENGQYLTNEELQALYKYIPKEDNLSKILEGYLSN